MESMWVIIKWIFIFSFWLFLINIEKYVKCNENLRWNKGDVCMYCSDVL